MTNPVTTLTLPPPALPSPTSMTHVFSAPPKQFPNNFATVLEYQGVGPADLSKPLTAMVYLVDTVLYFS